ncbi:hypothetical protein V8E54_000861 [Elaphomyces granulatus]|jgi:hypothetical protein
MDVDCLELFPTKVGTKWTVDLQLSKPDSDRDGDGDEDGVCDELARTTFMIRHVLQKPFHTSEAFSKPGTNLPNSLTKRMNTMASEDGTWDELAETTFNIARKAC